MSDSVTRARALLAAATPGPWRVASPDECEVGDVVVYAGGCGQCECSFGCEGRTFDVAGRLDTADAELIAAAPTLLVELANEVERLRARLDAVMDIHSDRDGDCAECEMSTGQGVDWPCWTYEAAMGVGERPSSS